GRETRPSCQDIHWHAWDRLSHPPVAGRGLSSAGDTLLHGPLGVGKTLFLRRFYWHLFDHQDAEVPLLISIPSQPFRPVSWATRFVFEVVQQWVAFARRSVDLAQANLLPLASLQDLCYAERLAPLAAFLAEMYHRDALHQAAGGGAEEGAQLIQWAFDELEGLAVQKNQPLHLLLDGAENAHWTEAGQSLYLTRLVSRAEASGFPHASQPEQTAVRRVWTSRVSPQTWHPLLPPLPDVSNLVALDPLHGQAAQDFFEQLASSAHVDYDATVFARHARLWGGIPRWLANFAHGCAQAKPGSLILDEEFLNLYLEDLCNGASARDIQQALYPPAEALIEPLLMARVLQNCLMAESPRYGGASPLPPEEQQALVRLARSGLAVCEGGQWRVAETPLLRDALEMYVARLLHGESPERRRLVLKRKRLVETPTTGPETGDIAQRLRDTALLLSAFRGQEVRAQLFRTHERGLSVAEKPVPLTQAATLSRRAAPAHQASGLAEASQAARGALTQLPYCIGAFTEQVAGAATSAWVVGWCFDGTEHYRSDEQLWIVVLCDVPVLTSEEVARIERIAKRQSLDLDVKRTRVWILSNARYSPEAAERVETLGFLTSTWSDFQTLGKQLFRAPGREPAAIEPADAKLHAPALPSASPSSLDQPIDPDSVFEMPTGKMHDQPAPRASAVSVPILPPRPARIVPLGQSSAMESTVELRLSPRDGMELVAAKTIEELALGNGFSEEAAQQLRMAVLEGCLNAIESSRNAEKEICVQALLTDEKCCVVIENEGEVFDPQKVRENDGERHPFKRGRGLKLIERFMDRAVFEPFEHGTRLRMEKRKPVRGQADASAANRPGAKSS
ncbi:MAG TPA: ATP-binding protein, partial [Candidatus Sumerlaeota bacterium]|nr:ATP-binding protein [Candidatus Sumerlaeota bacterium]